MKAAKLMMADRHGERARKRRRGLTLLELLAVVTILGIIAIIMVNRMDSGTDNAKVTSCHANRGNIEVQCQLYYRNEGTWPAADLSDIGADPSYFPDGLPTCPFDGASYTFDSASQSVTGHDHD